MLVGVCVATLSEIILITLRDPIIHIFMEDVEVVEEI